MVVAFIAGKHVAQAPSSHPHLYTRIYPIRVLTRDMDQLLSQHTPDPLSQWTAW